MLEFEAWKSARATWRKQVDSKAEHEECICSTVEKPVIANLKITNYDNLSKVCKTCYTLTCTVIKTWKVDMENTQRRLHEVGSSIVLEDSTYK